MSPPPERPLLQALAALNRALVRLGAPAKGRCDNGELEATEDALRRWLDLN